MSRRVVAVVAAAVILGPRVASAERGWAQLTSEHFVLKTELPPSEADALLHVLEEARAAMLTMVWGSAPGPRGG